MPNKFHYGTVTAYRELPPRYRIIESDGSLDDAAGRQVEKLDRNAPDGTTTHAYDASAGDLLGLILGRQSTEHAATASNLSRLILNRKSLTKKQLSDIQWRIDDLMGRRPIHLPPEGKIPEAEKMIIDLEHQKRQAEVNEWRDLLELRRALVDERKAYEAANARWRYLSGGSLTGYGGGYGAPN
jgi:hypothetical protein